MFESRVTAQLKKIVAERAQCCCKYCRSQARFAIQSFSIKHLIPRSQGGKTTLDNLALSCQGCNNHKYNKTEGRDPVSGDIVPLFHPRQQRWSDHFGWNDNFTLMIGLTHTGRTTVEALQLNREALLTCAGYCIQWESIPPLTRINEVWER